MPPFTHLCPSNCPRKAMTTKGLAKETKSDVCAWLKKAIYLHESLPQLCDEHAPELLGEPGPGVTSASSAFLMSLSALLLRLGSWKFANADDEVHASGLSWSSRLRRKWIYNV